MTASALPPLVSEKWWDEKTVAIVTGANKGIGYYITKKLAAEGVLVIATARDETLGKAAVAKLTELAGPASRIEFHQLDVTDAKSIERLATWVQATHGKVDILVNNAGIAVLTPDLDGDDAQKTIDTNFLAVVNMCDRFKSLMPKGARIVTVSSELGTTKQIKDAALIGRFTSATKTAEIHTLAKEFVQAVRDKKSGELHWTPEGAFYPIYSLSKLHCSQYTRILATELPDLMVNVCCPGYCATDLNNNAGSKSAEDGADTPAWLALRPDFVTGQFWSERTSKPF